MSQTIDMPNYTIELSDGLIRPMTVKELAVRLEQLMSADKRIAEMPVGLSVDSEGNGIYVPRVFVAKEPARPNSFFVNDILHYGILVLSDYRKGALCMESGL